jgi:polyisoprenoid-binding protein YceI
MIGRAFQWIGALALLGAAGAGIGSLMIVKDRIQVVVREDDGADRPDPLALVRDELQQLHGDLDALTQAMSENLGKVGGYLQELGNGQQAQSQQLAEQLSLMRQQSDTARKDAATQLSALQEELLAVEGRLRQRFAQAQLGSAKLAQTQPGEQAATAPDPTAGRLAARLTPAHSEAAKPEAAKPEAAKLKAAELEAAMPEAAKQQPKKKLGFLSFKLPKSRFQFDAASHYKVLGSLSRVGFDAKSTLHDFTGVTSKIEGDVYANLADPSYPWHGAIECDSKALKTGVEGRDSEMYHKLRTEESPRIRFEVQRFVADAKGIDAKAQRCKGTIHGQMTIAGKSHALTMPVEIKVDASKRVIVEGQQRIKLSDFGIEAPNQLGLISMEDEVKIWISLRARSVGAAGDAREARHND